MKYFFNTTNIIATNVKKTLKNHSYINEIAETLSLSEGISTREEFQSAIEGLIKKAQKFKMPKCKIAIHPRELPAIKKHKPLTEETPWGGVALKKVDVEKDFIQKLLVINEHGVLGFEFHKEKLEKLEVLEGYCLVLYSNHKAKGYKNGQVKVKLATAGDTFQFLPYDEHGVIALTDCTIEETSTNHLDDLFYIFKATQVTI